MGFLFCPHSASIGVHHLGACTLKLPQGQLQWLCVMDGDTKVISGFMIRGLDSTFAMASGSLIF